MKHPNKTLKDFKRLHRLYENGAIFTAFDTETTALSPTTGRIMEIGAVKFSKDGIISKWNHLFNPNTKIPYPIQQLTHITQQMVDCEPPIKNHLSDFLDFISDTVLIAHNAQFDLNFLNAECVWAGYKETHNKTICTLQYSKWAFPDIERHKLDFLADNLNLNKGTSHRALDDADTCRQLFLRCVEIGLNKKAASTDEGGITQKSV